MADLDPTALEIVRLAYWDGLNHAEIGAVLGLSTNAVAVRLHRARAGLPRPAHTTRGRGGAVMPDQDLIDEVLVGGRPRARR